jgi:hypothetical protein
VRPVLCERVGVHRRWLVGLEGSGALIWNVNCRRNSA